MKALGLLLAAGLCLSTSAHAQTAAPADSRAIADCLKAAEEKGEFGGACIGVIADPCIKDASNKNSDVEDSKKCAARELAVWSALMAKALQGVKKGGFKEIEKAAASAQKTWADSVKVFCPPFDKLDPGMAMGGANYCRLQETARRALLLQRLAAAVNEH